MRISIIGFGSFGTALSVHLANLGHDVFIIARDRELLSEASRIKENKKYLPGVILPNNIQFTLNDMEEIDAIDRSEIILFSVSSQGFSETILKYKDIIPSSAIIINVAKGIEMNFLKRLSEISEEILPDNIYVALSGPSHAEEIALALPTTIVASSKDKKASKMVQEIFFSDRLRVYTNSDLIGVEIGGALKNIMALAAGISDGLGYGDNAKAALMTRGLAEIKRLGIVLGAKEETFSGLTGIGDLIVTCTSMHSRNRRCGILIGQGISRDDAVNEIGMVVEGIYTCYGADKLANKLNVEMPITAALRGCLDGEISPEDAINSLMLRSPKEEN